MLDNTRTPGNAQNTPADKVQRKEAPAQGKRTQTSKIAPRSGAPVQLEAAPAASSASSGSASSWTSDNWTDAALRGAPVQMKESNNPQPQGPAGGEIPTREQVHANPEAYGIPPGASPDDWFNEYIAHTVAYMQPEELDPNALDPSDPEYQSKLATIQRHHDTMRAWGYDPGSLTFINDSELGDRETGLQAMRIDPLDPSSGLGSIVGMRGTEPFAAHQSTLTNPTGALDDIATDLGRDVGSTQYNANQDRIRALMAGGVGPMTVTGHSLGGALAQHAAAGNSDLNIANVVGFQAPGIGSAAADRFDQANADGHMAVRFHEHSNDVVHRAGEQKLGGTHFNWQDTNDPGVGGAHGSNFMYNGIGSDGNQVSNVGAGSSPEVSNTDQITNRLGWEGGRRVLGGTLNVAASPFQGAFALGQGLGNAAVNAGSGLAQSGSDLVTGVGRGGQTLGSGVASGASQIADGEVLSGLGTMASGTARGLGQMAGGVWDGTTGVLKTGAGLVGDTAKAVGSGVATVATEAWDGLGTVGSGLLDLGEWGVNGIASWFD